MSCHLGITIFLEIDDRVQLLNGRLVSRDTVKLVRN